MPAPSRHPLAWRVALLATLAVASFAPPAAAQNSPCPTSARDEGAQPEPQKPRLGGLFAVARNANLAGALAGAVRGERDLELELQQMARTAGERAVTSVAETAACRAQAGTAATSAKVQDAVDLYTARVN